MNKSSLFFKLMIPLVATFVLVAIVISIVVPNLVESNAVKDAEHTALGIVKQYKSLRAYYTKNVVKKVIAGSELRPHYEHQDDPSKIPLPATMIHELSGQLEKEDLKIKLYSDYPFPNRADRQLDAFEKRAWDTIIDDPEAVITELQDQAGQPVVRVAIADFMVADACVACHNNHPETPKVGWSMGDVRGVLEVTQVIEDQFAAGQLLSMKIVAALVVGLIVALAAMVLIYRKVVMHRVENFNEALSVIADGGDMKKRLEASGHDELDQLALTYNRVADKIDDTMHRLGGISTQIMGASEILSTSASRNSAQLSSQQTETDSVAQAVQEMNGKVQEIAQNAASAAHSAEQADEQAATSLSAVDHNREVVNHLSEEIQDAQAVIARLEQDSEEIGSVVDVIRGIAEQTNLLALNAAIEAARAGEQGRGFAVVADEVRNLASKTQSSTEEIHQKIESIREGTTRAVGVMGKSVDQIDSTVNCANDISAAIHQVVEAIKSMRTVNAAIATATDEQSRTAQALGDSLIHITETTDRSVNESVNVKTSGEQLVALSNMLRTIATEYESGAGVGGAMEASMPDADMGDEDVLF